MAPYSGNKQKGVWLGIILLFTSSWIPYSISVVNIDPMNALGQTLYGVSVLLVTFSNLALSVALYRCHIDIAECNVNNHMKLLMIKYIPDIAIKVIGLIVANTVYPLAMGVSVLLAMIWMLLPIKLKGESLED